MRLSFVAVFVLLPFQIYSHDPTNTEFRYKHIAWVGKKHQSSSQMKGSSKPGSTSGIASSSSASPMVKSTLMKDLWNFFPSCAPTNPPSITRFENSHIRFFTPINYFVGFPTPPSATVPSFKMLKNSSVSNFY